MCYIEMRFEKKCVISISDKVADIVILMWYVVYIHNWRKC